MCSNLSFPPVKWKKRSMRLLLALLFVFIDNTQWIFSEYLREGSVSRSLAIPGALSSLYLPLVHKCPWKRTRSRPGDALPRWQTHSYPGALWSCLLSCLEATSHRQCAGTCSSTPSRGGDIGVVRDAKAAQEQNIELKKAIKFSRFFRDFFFPLGSPLLVTCICVGTQHPAGEKNSLLKRFPRQNSRQDVWAVTGRSCNVALQSAGI